MAWWGVTEPVQGTRETRRWSISDIPANDDSLLVRASCWPVGLQPNSILRGATYAKRDAAWVLSNESRYGLKIPSKTEKAPKDRRTAL